MKIISINAGSSSLKFRLFDMTNETVIASGLFERIGMEESFYTIKYNGESIREDIDLPSQLETVKILMDKLLDLEIISSLEEIKGIGYRVVTGGEKYKDSVLITDEVIQDIIDLKEFAPLHNPQAAIVIQAFKEVLPDTPMVAVFDTTFHQSMPEVSYIYSVPYDWYENYKVRKYGAHGTSYRYVCGELEKEFGSEYKAIICHLGSGASISAVENGKCVDTTMGFTPVSGIMMNTRSGDVDPSIVTYIMEKEGKNALEVLNDLNNVSGFLGMSGISADSRDVAREMKAGNKRCELAMNKFYKRILAYIGEYYVLLGGIDALVFTAGIGENRADIRATIVDKLSCLGFKLDEKENEEEGNPNRGKIRKISTNDSKSAIYVIPTDEELVIARDTLSLVSNR